MNRATAVSNLWQLPTAIVLMLVAGGLLSANLTPVSTPFNNEVGVEAISYGWPCSVKQRFAHAGPSPKTTIGGDGTTLEMASGRTIVLTPDWGRAVIWNGASALLILVFTAFLCEYIIIHRDAGKREQA